MLEGFSRRLAPEQRTDLIASWDRAGFEEAIDRLATELEALKQGQIGQQLQRVKASMEPIRQWANQLKEQLEPQLASIRTIGEMSLSLKQRVLIVDDYNFQHKLLRRILADMGVEWSSNSPCPVTKRLV